MNGSENKLAKNKKNGKQKKLIMFLALTAISFISSPVSFIFIFFLFNSIQSHINIFISIIYVPRLTPGLISLPARRNRSLAFSFKSWRVVNWDTMEDCHEMGGKSVEFKWNEDEAVLVIARYTYNLYIYTIS